MTLKTRKTSEETQLFYDSLNINRISGIDRAGLKAQRATYGPRAIVCRCLDQSSKGLWQSGRRNNNHVDCWASRRGLHLPTPPTFSFPFCHFVCGEKKVTRLFQCVQTRNRRETLGEMILGWKGPKLQFCKVVVYQQGPAAPTIQMCSEINNGCF